MKSVTIPQAPPLMMWKHPGVLQPKILPKSDNDLFPRWSAEGSLQRNHQKLGAVGGEKHHYCLHLHIYSLIRNSLDKQHYPPTPPPYTHTCTELSPGERGLGEGLQRLPIQIIGNLSNGPGWILTKLLAYVARHSSEAKWVASLRWNVWPHRLLNYWLKFCTDANKQDFWLVKYSNLFLVVLSKFIIPYKPLEYNPRYLETKLTKKYQVLVKCRSQYISISCGSNNTGSWFT